MIAAVRQQTYLDLGCHEMDTDQKFVPSPCLSDLSVRCRSSNLLLRRGPELKPAEGAASIPLATDIGGSLW